MARQPEPWQRKGQKGAWYAQVRGRQRRLAGPEATKEQAWEALYRLLGNPEAEATTPADPVAPATFGAILDGYLSECRAKRDKGEMTPRTFDNYASLLSAAESELGHLHPARLDERRIRAWLERPEWGAARRRSALGMLRQAVRWATRAGYMASDPSATIKAPPAVRREFDATADVRARVLAEAARTTQGQALVDLIAACIETGCRPGEVAAVTAADIDLAGGTWRVKNKTRRATGRVVRTVYLSPKAVEISARLMAAHPAGPIFRNAQGRPWITVTWGKHMRAIRKKLGIADLVLYSMRHGFITDSLEAGINPAVVAELVGHASLEMIVRVYSKLAQRRTTLADAVRKVRPGDEPPKPAGKRKPKGSR